MGVSHVALDGSLIKRQVLLQARVYAGPEGRARAQLLERKLPWLPARTNLQTSKPLLSMRQSGQAWFAQTTSVMSVLASGDERGTPLVLYARKATPRHTCTTSQLSTTAQHLASSDSTQSKTKTWSTHPPAPNFLTLTMSPSRSVVLRMAP